MSEHHEIFLWPGLTRTRRSVWTTSSARSTTWRTARWADTPASTPRSSAAPAGTTSRQCGASGTTTTTTTKSTSCCTGQLPAVNTWTVTTNSNMWSLSGTWRNTSKLPPATPTDVQNQIMKTSWRTSKHQKRLVIFTIEYKYNEQE